MTMHRVVLFAVYASFLVLVVSGDDCPHPSPVEKFVSSVYTALIVSNDPDFIDNFSMKGGEAGMDVYNVVQKVLDEARVCNADEIAFIAGRSVARAGNLTLPPLFKKVAYTVGEALFKYKALDCANAIPLALEFFGYFEKESAGLDKTQLDTYFLGLFKGYGELLATNHLDLGPVTTDAVEVFAQIFDAGDKPKCKYDEEEAE